MVSPSIYCPEHAAVYIAVSVTSILLPNPTFFYIGKKLQGYGGGVGIARSQGNEPGVGVGVGVNQATSAPTPDRLLQLNSGLGDSNFFSVKFSRISSISKFRANIGQTMKDSDSKLFR